MEIEEELEDLETGIAAYRSDAIELKTLVRIAEEIIADIKTMNGWKGEQDFNQRLPDGEENALNKIESGIGELKDFL